MQRFVVDGSIFEAARAFNRTNIIVRNLTFEDTYDCFPEWSPTDGAQGAWNALYNSISLRNSDHVWIDHNTFVDRDTADSKLPYYFGVLYQVHDGQLDITNASDFVTVSWNCFEDHDKVMLIGSSDSATADQGKLKVTIHHNLFENMGQRTPRVRYGQVHVYNNYYKISNPDSYVYSWGIGIQSAIYAENNFFWVNSSTPITPSQFIMVFKGTAIHESGTLLNSPSQSGHHAVDVLAAYNEVNDPDLLSDTGLDAGALYRLAGHAGCFAGGRWLARGLSTGDHLRELMDLNELQSLYDFTGRTVLVTGGAGVLGSEIACALVGCNANVSHPRSGCRAGRESD